MMTPMQVVRVAAPILKMDERLVMKMGHSTGLEGDEDRMNEMQLDTMQNMDHVFLCEQKQVQLAEN